MAAKVTKFGEHQFVDAGKGKVICIHCGGTGDDPLDPGRCYLCDGKKVIPRELAEHTCDLAESGGFGVI